MQVEAAFPAGGEWFELVQEGEGLLDDVAEFAPGRGCRGGRGGR